MCGINGIYSLKKSKDEKLGIIQSMNDDLIHRGPDADGVWSSGDIALGHRRLSIIDLDQRSNQPLMSYDNRYVIVYNGEIYNFKELKFELSRAPHGTAYEPYPFKTLSDTEVILAAYIRYGKDCLHLFNGMFAFAVWDNVKKELFIARDRLGIKPFYYYKSDDLFVFSSEIRSILNSRLIEKKISLDALFEYLSYQTVHAPNSIIKDVKVLMPGHYISCTAEHFEIKQWWNIGDSLVKNNDQGEVKTVKNEIRNLFFNSVERRLVADVPSGVFLSGGIDSSAVVGAVANFTLNKIDTFNVTFNENDFSESRFARLISGRFNTNHHEIKLDPESFLKLLPESLEVMDHPGGDGPNTYVVSKAVREFGIKMALTGIGGDELFCGYDLFQRLYALERKWWLNAVPRFIRVGIAEIIRVRDKSTKTQKFAELLSKPIINFEYAYPVFRKTLSDALVRGITGSNHLPMNSVYRILRTSHFETKNKLLSKYSIAEMTTYLPNVLLRDADQMSMSLGLELRVPFLDYRLVEYVLSINDKVKFPSTPKQLLCESLHDLIPREIWDRPKMGFTLPWEYWMRNQLKGFCEENLKSLGQREYINGNVVSALWNRFLKGDQEITWSRIWHLVVLGYWLNANGIE